MCQTLHLFYSLPLQKKKCPSDDYDSTRILYVHIWYTPDTYRTYYPRSQIYRIHVFLQWSFYWPLRCPFLRFRTNVVLVSACLPRRVRNVACIFFLYRKMSLLAFDNPSDTGKIGRRYIGLLRVIAVARWALVVHYVERTNFGREWNPEEVFLPRSSADK